jgi:phenylalanyl-tRNA synthetase beta chain
VEALRIENPLGEEHSVMRPLLLPGLLDAARHNAAHGRAGIALFESAHVYLPAGPLEPAPEGSPKGAAPADEHHHLSALLTEAAPPGWRAPAREADFYAAKALLEAVMEAAGVEDWRVEAAPAGGGAAGDGSAAAAPRAFLHPGRAASIVTGEGVELGWIGELHPLVVREWELQGTGSAFELEVDLLHELTHGRIATYSDVTSFPAVLQDIAVIVPEDVPAARLEEVVRAGAGDLLASVRVFDLYHGEQVGEGNKSLALRLEFRAPDRTLTDEEVAERRAAIEKELGSIGGHLRA